MMSNLFSYLLSVALIFSALYLTYQLFLRKLTFHKTNRVILLLMLPASLVIPYIAQFFPTDDFGAVTVPSYIAGSLDAASTSVSSTTVSQAPTIIDGYVILGIVYAMVCVLFMLKIVLTARTVYGLKKHGVTHYLDGYCYVCADVPQIFTYFNFIFVPRHSFEQYDQQVLEHEKIHVQLNHSWDILFTEIYRAFFWFNPLLLSYQKSLKVVHEYQADQGVLQQGMNTSAYLQLLLNSLSLKQAKNSYSYFNQPTLKKRVLMMTKQKSTHLTKFAYFTLLPVCVLFIVAFSPSNTQPPMIGNEVIMQRQMGTPPPSLFPVQDATKEHITSHFGTKGKNSTKDTAIFHTGIDIRATQGTPVLATAKGTVVKASDEGDWGNLIILKHPDGYETWYAHLKDFAKTANQQVEKGEIIGYVGSTGRSTGPHLHYEVIHNKKHVDPMDYFD